MKDLTNNIGYLVDFQLCNKTIDKAIHSISYVDQGIMDFLHKFGSKIVKVRSGSDFGINIHCKNQQEKSKIKILCIDQNKDNSIIKYFIYIEETK